MKKLKLDLQSLNAEVLTRSQLKQILGGDGGSGGCPAGQFPCTCTCGDPPVIVYSCASSISECYDSCCP